MNTVTARTAIETRPALRSCQRKRERKAATGATQSRRMNATAALSAATIANTILAGVQHCTSEYDACSCDARRRQTERMERATRRHFCAPASFLPMLLATLFLILSYAGQAVSSPSLSRTQQQQHPQQQVASNPSNRFVLKRSMLSYNNPGTVDGERVIAIEDANVPVFFTGRSSGQMRPMLPDKWNNIFLAHQERSFFPSAYGGGGASGGAFSSFSDNHNGIGAMEKRRQGLLDEAPMPLLVNNYESLVEPGRLEWNFNRL